MTLAMDRSDFIATMTAALNGEPSAEAAFGGRLRAGQLKSRLLEAHPPERSTEGCGVLLSSFAERAGLDLQALDDDLWALLSPDDVFFFDTANARFWQLHSTAPAAAVESLVKTRLIPDHRVDSAWMPAHLMREFEGTRTWLKSSFDSGRLVPADGDPARRWRMQLEGDAPEELLALIGNNERYASNASLTAVGSTIVDGKRRARLATDFQGKVVSLGTSFELIAGVLWRTARRYERYIGALEGRYRLSTNPCDSDGLQISGDIATLELQRHIPDLELFLDGLFSCRAPFRLWAVPREVASEQWEANAVDLHVGHPLRLEITPRWIRVMLDEDTCGNTLARLIANLQQHFDARAELPVGASPVTA
jgi:hypothetical protein